MPDEHDIAGAVLARTKREGGCLLWTGATNSTGYGMIRRRPRAYLVHRVIYEHTHGPLADLHVHHACGRRTCVEITHLVATTHAAHTRLHTIGRRKTHCKRGHPLTPEGRLKSGACRLCNRLRQKAYDQRRSPRAR